MDRRTADRAGQESQPRKTRDRAAILLLLGVVLLMPPAAAIFNLDARIGGLPLTLVYLFAVWAGLIVLTALLSRQLGAIDRPGADGDDPGHRG
ncbi:MAG: hypothetical protein AAF415_16620 [Pseudomonadota bacterium]